MVSPYQNSFNTKQILTVAQKTYTIYSLAALAKKGFDLSRLPFSLKVLLENLLRQEDGRFVKKEDIETLAKWKPGVPQKEITFTPARVLMQDFTGVPAVVDLAAMRDAMKRLGGDPNRINPLVPADLVIDHSVQVDKYGDAAAFQHNSEMEFYRNRERYQFLRWGQSAFRNFRIVPPETGIVHQVNLEYLAEVVMAMEREGELLAYPDTLVGTDSHTTMINGLGVVGWGVGGIEAEAAMLGQPISMLIPEVVGFKLTGELPEGSTATDAVLTVTQMLRKKGVVGKFVEFYGEGIASLSLADRATIANMAPEYGATIGFFPIDQVTLDYMKLTGRSAEVIARTEAYAKAQGLFHDAKMVEPLFNTTLSLDLKSVVPSVAGPKRPQDRVDLKNVQTSWGDALKMAGPKHPEEKVKVTVGSETFELSHGSIVIGAITSCTNTSNPSVMIGAGLVAKKAVEKGLKVKPWVKTSLAPGSKTVIEYLKKTGLLPFLEQLNFNLVGYGCTTCIGNSGPLLEPISKAIADHDLVVASVLSGNRNFEGRVHPQVRANYLASPPLVVAYSLVGHMNINLTKDSLGTGKDGKPVYLKDLWPSPKEIQNEIRDHINAETFRKSYASVLEGDAIWKGIKTPEGSLYPWDAASTYIQHPPYFEGMTMNPEPLQNISRARVLAMLGDSVTTDHISPAGSISKTSPAARYLSGHGVEIKDFNSYGSRRGNHEVMMRGTFANIRLRNQLAPGTEGGETVHLPERTPMSIFDAAMKYAEDKIPLMILAGKEYGSGSSRDWAAKGPALQSVKVVIAESYERIHRSNLIGMGILPLEYQPGQNRETLGLTGEEVFSMDGISVGLAPRKTLTVHADGKQFEVITRIDTPEELEYYRHGGILRYVLRNLLKS